MKKLGSCEDLLAWEMSNDPATRRVARILGSIPTPPVARLLGWRLLSGDADEGWIRIGYEGRDDFLNSLGVVQGRIGGDAGRRNGPSNRHQGLGNAICSYDQVGAELLLPCADRPPVR